MKKLAIAVLALAILVCLYRIGASIVDYEVSVMDLNAPTINIKPSPIPQPWSRSREPHFSPPVVHRDPTVCDDSCWQRAVVKI